MPNKEKQKTIRALFSIEPEPSEAVVETKAFDHKIESERVVKRLINIVNEHHRSSLPLGVSIDQPLLRIITAALREHAQGEEGRLDLNGCDEILSHCLTRLFEELVEEPSNILYTTPTSPESTQYDAMDSSFWIDCLNLLEQRFDPAKIN